MKRHRGGNASEGVGGHLSVGISRGRAACLHWQPTPFSAGREMESAVAAFYSFVSLSLSLSLLFLTWNLVSGQMDRGGEEELYLH